MRCVLPESLLTQFAQTLEHEFNEKHYELEVMMTRIRGRCFSFFFAWMHHVEISNERVF
jgi:hypothetical protein